MTHSPGQAGPTGATGDPSGAVLGVRDGRYLTVVLRTYGIVLALVILAAGVTVASPAFVSKTNLFNLTSQWAPAGIMAVGMTYVILTGGFDLSIAAGYSLTAVVAAAVGLHQSQGTIHYPDVVHAAA